MTHITGSTRSVRVHVVASLLLTFLFTGCGTRVTREEARIAVSPENTVSITPDFSTGSGAASDGANPTTSGHAVSTTRPATAPSSKAPARGTGSDASATAPALKASDTARPAPAAKTPPVPSPSPNPTAPGTPTGGSAPKEPILLGQNGTFTGPAAASFVGSVAGVQAWARAVNDRGGIDGHSVKVITVDDGGDRARATANIKDLVERRGVTAIIAEYAPITRSSYQQYLAEKRVPVVGGEGATAEWHTNPMYFPVGVSGNTVIAGTAYESAKEGKKKAAFLYCAEIADCSTAVSWFKDGAKDVGVQVVYEAQISLAQPDFTAECLQAKNRGADALGMVADSNTIQRIASSCARQAYYPLLLASHSMQTSAMASFHGIDGGLLGAQPQLPWFTESGTPSIDEYNRSIKRYAPSQRPGQDVIIGWISGKLFEKAMALRGSVPGRVAPQDVLTGLWKIQNDTLDGFMAPTTFREGKPADTGHCWFPTRVQRGSWLAPNGLQPVCVNRTFAG